ncbi:helix-turn-helix transcriptional regulator [Mobilitalea sibirica]|uniref:Helix-turn-helix transcriptional regulator n=1 Tax=Mobilitalea sibirica TaxID=1462919 RepID=A0A8J7KXT2_9FIRM|nr:AraC family transcriptional regulator [Mobilitalea sibirica]MBH1942207.1 helix-turn-helix transcriptional regulator [Mobilitalea sibirica]
MLDTIGFQYFTGYVFALSVSGDPTICMVDEAKEYFKIIYMKSGTCHFLLNQKEIVLTGSNAICLNEKDKIEFHEYPKQDIKVIIFKPKLINGAFDPDYINHPNPSRLSSTIMQDLYYLKQFKWDTQLNRKLLPLRAMDSTVMEHRISQMQEELLKQDNSNWPCRSRSYLFEILFCLVRQEGMDETVSNVQIFNGCSKLAVDVICYLQTCYNQKITIEKLTEEFHTNRTTLLTDFKKYTGSSINRYLVQLRLSMASTLLRDTQLSVEEICERTGFSDISYFSKAFKKRINYTPSEYRRIYNHK